MENKPFNMRSATAFLVTAAFLLCAVTGIVLFIVPQGRIANWVDWRFVGMLKDEWAQIHITFGLLFLIFGILHLYPYNWPIFKAYLAKRTAGRLDYRRPRKEFVATGVLSVLLVVGAAASLPPVSYLFAFNDWAKDAWVVSKDYEPPFGHAEELSLTSFTKKMNMDLDAAMAELRAKGLAFDGPTRSLGEIAKANGISAMDVYMLIKKFETAPEPVDVAEYTPEKIEELFSGRGVGRKTLAEFCAEIGFPVDQALARLKAAGAEVTADLTTKDIATALDVTPIDVLKIALVKPGRS